MTSRLLGDRYRLVEAIGRGGMGTVWLGHDDLLDRQVAVKEVRIAEGLSAQEREAVLERQLREARICARLNHPSIVTVHDVIQEDERPWVVMELIKGRGLNSVVADEGPMEPEQVADVGYQALDALGHAHAAGVLHRDIKPSNLMLTPEGGVIITDFGIATLEGDSRLTREGGVIGSPGYLAPEQVQGEEATPASDVWALGATLYFLAEGRPAYKRANAAATALAPVSSDPDPPERSLPLWPLLSEMMERDPGSRPSVADAQSRLADYDSSSAHSPTPPESREYHTGPRPSHAAALAPPTSRPQPESGPWAASGTGAHASHSPPHPGAYPGASADSWSQPARHRGTPLLVLLGGGAIALLILVGVVAAAFVIASSEEPDESEPQGLPVAQDDEEAEDEASLPPAPGCATAESETLHDLVPEAALTEDEETTAESWSERYCEWRTTGPDAGGDGYASVLFMRFVEEDGMTPQENAAHELDLQTQEYDGEPVEDLGDEAASWYDEVNSIGCLGARDGDVYIRVCYDAAQGPDTTESIPVQEAVAGARDIAEQTVAEG